MIHHICRSLTLLVPAVAVCNATPTPLEAQMAGQPHASRACEWTIADRPLRTLDGDVHQLTQVAGAAVLPGDRLVIADGMSMEVMAFDANGSILRRIGGSGGGPGEFRSIAWVRSYRADSIAVYDPVGGRLSVLGPDLSFARSVPLSQTSRVLIIGVLGPLADGRFVMAERVPQAARRTGLLQDTLRFRVAHADGRPGFAIGTFPGPERFISLDQGFSVVHVPFGQNPIYLGHGAAFYAIVGDTLFMRDLDRDQATMRALPLPDSGRAIRAGDLDAYVQQRVEQADRNRAVALDRLLRSIPHGDRVDPYVSAATAPGRIWLRVAGALGRRNVWSSISNTAEMEGRLALPLGDVIVGGTDSTVVIARPDALEVPSVYEFLLRGECGLGN
jgi:hypothetical protein